MPHPRTYVVTGADSGLGRAVADLLAARGRVITCGLADGVDVRADLTTTEGRADLVERVRSLGGGRVDGVVAAAGAGAPRPETVALNYFGATGVLEGLRDCLAASDAPAAVVVSSSSTLNRGSGALVRACRSGDERRALAVARRLTRTGRGSQLYRSSKAALNLWTRATAVSPEWTRDGIVLNAVAPGIVATDVVTRTWERDRVLLETALPQPLGAPGPVAPVADLLAFLVSRENRFTTGQVVYCDGGTDALTRGGRPQRVHLRYGVRAMATMAREARRRTTTP
ncbi:MULTISPECIES: SDR family oxidoreductase [unclassified Isoptericola]|uniref:SDR family oxidoreductase n=1 Tax=unclassified Isoptericola TaxID=2623355 RepID=UPI00379CCBEB|nr:SDR family oxidoreductase [Isoptericola sp. QY 916]